MQESGDLLTDLKQASAIKTKTYELHTLTPLLMHGWQQSVRQGNKVRNNPLKGEARLASFKGVIRYWWRTVQPVMDTKQLYLNEAELFGGSGLDKESKKSKLILSLKAPVEGYDKEEMFPHKNRAKTFAVSKSKKLLLEQSIYKKDDTFESYFNYLMQYIFHVAGFGQRARRGFGSFQIEGMDWKSEAAFLQSLQDCLTALEFPEKVTPVDDKTLQMAENHASFPVLRHVYLGKSFTTPEEATKVINQASSEVKHEFGTALGNHNPRKASPLHGTVRKIGDGYLPVLTEVHMKGNNKLSSDYTSAVNYFVERVRK